MRIPRTSPAYRAIMAAVLFALPILLLAQSSVPPAKQVMPAPTIAPKSAASTLPPTARPPAAKFAKPPAATLAPDDQPGDKPGQEPAEATINVPLKITLTPSETPLKLGLTSNVAAIIQNVSSKPVQINLSALQLTTHSIVASHASRCVTSLPASTNITGATKSADGYYFVTLQPADQMSALFNLSQSTDPFQSSDDPTVTNEIKRWKEACAVDNWDRMLRSLDFSPGNYEYYLTGYYYANNAAGVPTLRIFSSSASFPVGIDQTTVILFAVLGGWLALLVVTFMNADNEKSLMGRMSKVPVTAGGWRGFLQRLTSSESFKVLLHFFIQLVGVAILSAAFTIVSSRLSDTQLPVKISILDAWGAMTVGFVSYFIGKKFINSLANWGGETSTSSKQK